MIFANFRTEGKFSWFIETFPKLIRKEKIDRHFLSKFLLISSPFNSFSTSSSVAVSKKQTILTFFLRLKTFILLKSDFHLPKTLFYLF